MLMNAEQTKVPVVCKKCCACGQIKPVEAFHRRKRGDGYQYACKVCINTRDSQGKYIATQNYEKPPFVECLNCGKPAACDLDNPFWLNQYSDDMTNYSALCSDRCFKELNATTIRMKQLIDISKESV